jgi:hypothetical protein
MLFRMGEPRNSYVEADWAEGFVEGCGARVPESRRQGRARPVSAGSDGKQPGAGCRQASLGALAGAGSLGRRDDIQVRPLTQFFTVVTQKLASCSIHIDNPRFQVDLVVPNWRLVVEIAITLLRIPDGLLSLRSLGDVGDEGIKALCLARLIAENIDHQLQGTRAVRPFSPSVSFA